MTHSDWPEGDKVSLYACAWTKYMLLEAPGPGLLKTVELAEMIWTCTEAGS